MMRVARKFKFRAWYENKMVGPFYLGSELSLGIFDFIEQFTGLLDAKGNEIYEGDIVLAKDHNPDHYRIEFREGGFCGVWGDRDNEWYPVDINHFYDSTGCCIEIVGNIHQP